MVRRKSLDCFQIQSGTIQSFRVLTSTDSDALAEHDVKRKDAIEAFWKNRHPENLVIKPLHYTDYTEICEMDKLSGFSIEEWVDEMDENNLIAGDYIFWINLSATVPLAVQMMYIMRSKSIRSIHLKHIF